MLRALGGLALASVLGYLGWARLERRAGPAIGAAGRRPPGERWLVLANAVAFGSAYVVGAWSTAFLLVLVLHHEVQYLYFTYALARRDGGTGHRGLVGEMRLLGPIRGVAVWSGLASWAACTLFRAATPLSPFLRGRAPLSHYWLDGRIWTAQPGPGRRVAVARPRALGGSGALFQPSWSIRGPRASGPPR